MKKILNYFLISVLSLTLFGCGGIPKVHFVQGVQVPEVVNQTTSPSAMPIEAPAKPRVTASPKLAERLTPQPQIAKTDTKSTPAPTTQPTESKNDKAGRLLVYYLLAAALLALAWKPFLRPILIKDKILPPVKDEEPLSSPAPANFVPTAYPTLAPLPDASLGDKNASDMQAAAKNVADAIAAYQALHAKATASIAPTPSEAQVGQTKSP